jgi:CheY-like chemotaxis protein
LYSSAEEETKLQQQKEQLHGTILAIDDETDIIKVIKNSSQIIGSSIDAFTDPLLALEQYRANNNEYFLIITDLAMPSMNGFEFIRKIRSTSPDIKIPRTDSLFDNLIYFLNCPSIIISARGFLSFGYSLS